MTTVGPLRGSAPRARRLRHLPSAAPRRLLHRLTAPAPPARLGVLRVLVGAYALGWLLVRLPHLWDLADLSAHRFDPVGPLMPLDQPPAATLTRVALVVAVPAGVAFVAGWRWRVSGPAFAALFLAVTAFESSWGQVFHTENLAALHLIVLATSPAAHAWSLDARRPGAGAAGRAATWRYGLAVRLCTLVTVLAYAVAGWAKLRNGGLDWVTGDVLRNHVAHDNLRKALVGDTYSPLAGLVLRHGWLLPPMAAASVAVELGAPVAAWYGHRLRRAWIAAAWLFHVGVLALMAIAFPYQLSGVAFASMAALEHWPGRLARRAATWQR